MVNTQQAQMHLDELKFGVIGIFKNHNGGVFELITDDNGDTIDTIYISSFGAIQQSFNHSKHYGQVEMFEQGVNMNQMLDNPFEWNEFMKRFN